MNIPLNHLYNHLGNLIGPDTLIYRFFPHGGKNLIDLSYCSTHLSWLKHIGQVPVLMIMHDQEPLNFDFYNSDYMRLNLASWFEKHNPMIGVYLESKDLFDFWCNQNLNFIGHSQVAWTLYDRSIIVHSEKNSPEIKKYQDIGLEPVYWWSHAIIARDWYRYAEFDPGLKHMPKTYQKDFNIYNRAWSGTREYRLKFLDCLIDANLVNCSNIRFNPIDDSCHYLNHQYKNSKFTPANQLELVESNNTHSSASAEYSVDDYLNHWFDVVLETLYDDSRHHLTEKIFRPIACGKPFILVGTAGSLSYLKDYGFKTFENVIDESYDLIQDPIERLKSIITTMKKISSMTPQEKIKCQEKIKLVTDFNQQRFFSDEFATQVLNEFITNAMQAKAVCWRNRFGRNLINFRRLASQNLNTKKKLLNHEKENTIKLLLEVRRLNE